ncbi:MAG: DUF4804 domain-containing protein [Sylvanvirus sp.]|uniref:DUF4804 domain-containing protein n=1 Tax=Sylvanvirus sp. TaxID=2487774 RepID=A0A3G5AIH6_9VIRU|nr:MAG: DUF4804 domain-containing protein [Sylvanvirus sp.]
MNEINEIKDMSRCINARIYYLARHIHPNLIPRLLMCVPQICVDQDHHIQLKSGQLCFSYEEALRYDSTLLTYEERILSRKKIIVSTSRLYAQGGYKTSFMKLSSPVPVIIVSACGAQFDVLELDAKLFVTASTRPIFLKDRFLESLKEDIQLWIRALKHYGSIGTVPQRYHFRICPIGAGFFAQHAILGDLSCDIQTLILQAFVDVLQHTNVPHDMNPIDHVEFTFFDLVLINPCIIQQLHQLFPCSFTMNDICQPLPPHQAHRQLVILNPSDSFCEIGNELEYSSVESEIGNNTTLRTDQSYRTNTDILRECNHIAVTI